MSFQPDYQHVVDAACNRRPRRIPLYEHIICTEVMEEILGVSFGDLLNGAWADQREFFRYYVGFFKQMGYDTVSFERCVGPIMPGSGALGGHKTGVIRDRKDFMTYPWEEIPNLFFEAYGVDFELLRDVMPPGMQAIGGPGNGVFECVQDVVGFTQLCYIKADDPDLYEGLFAAVGDMLVAIWRRFLREYGDIYAVCRFGDDLGFRSATLISPQDIKEKVIPEYARIVDMVHRFQKPFLLHSCGNIFEIMDELVAIAKIDAKHSNEDAIATFDVWIERYGDQIGNFGGIDTDVLCQLDEDDIKEYVNKVYSYASTDKGVALGSGNSIPDYVPASGYLAMVEAVRELRGEG